MNGSRRYAVIGRPVAHSLSPFIHEQFAGQLGLPISYGLLDPGTAGFTETVREFFANSGKGLNVTLPFKHDALQLADHLSHGARVAQAANTLKVDEAGEISACNTDGAGFLTDLQKNHSLQVKGFRVLVLGAGGAASGILGPLLGKCPRQVSIANRTSDKAEKLAERFAAHIDSKQIKLDGHGYADTLAGDYDLVINATSAGHDQQDLSLTAKVFSAGTCAYDLSYGAAAKSFLALAEKSGAALAIDGMGMLVEQAALSFAYWEGQMPETRPVIEKLRELV